MKIALITALAMLSGHAVRAQKTEDIKAIKSMCGCYEVEFNFAETFRHNKSADYKPSPDKYDYGLEWVELVDDSPNKLVLQHLLIVSDTTIVKHWRQDWEYENNRLYDFEGDSNWKFLTLPKASVKGQWTQRVFQVDDSPRYEASATWVHVDGRHFWTSTANAPLPRREHTIRSDYNILRRTNTHEITPFGWTHDQDNVKIHRESNGQESVIAEEKGFDRYRKVDDSKCKAAQNYWKKYAQLWKNVRAKWQAVLDRNHNLVLEATVDGQPLFMHLFDLAPDTPKSETDKVIDSFVKY